MVLETNKTTERKMKRAQESLCQNPAGTDPRDKD